VVCAFQSMITYYTTTLLKAAEVAYLALKLGYFCAQFRDLFLLSLQTKAQ